MLARKKSGMGAVLARDPSSSSSWQTAFSLNQPGPYGASALFPDLVQGVLDAGQLQAVIDAGPKSVTTGTFVFGMAISWKSFLVICSCFIVEDS